MINNKFLKINRVIIKGLSKVVYDQEFHSGLNVIRGDNGTGKSTIMELISYGIGGDIKKGGWKKEALECTNVTIELEINGRAFTFKRAIEEEQSKPSISMFEGHFPDSLKPQAEWFVYKNRRSDNRKSYSMQIFEMLGLEQHDTADSEALTVHQLLRILYIDQDTPASKIFRTEPMVYDKESMRRAIGDYAFGFDDLEAHTLRQQLNERNKRFDKIDSELKSIYQLLGKTNIKATIKELEGELEGLYEESKIIDETLIESKSDSTNYKDKELSKESVKLQKIIENKVNELSLLEQKFVSESYEISDSSEFLDNLEYRKRELVHARKAKEAIAHFDFKFCPSCMSTLDFEDENSCDLCKKELDDDFDYTYIQALNEIDFQISETAQILEMTRLSRSRLEEEIKGYKRNISRLRSEFNKLNSYTSDYQKRISTLSEKRGFVGGRVKSVEDRMKLAADLDSRRQFKDSLQNEISVLKDQLRKLEFTRENRVRSVKSKISEKVTYILSRDGGVEPSFDNAKKFDFDFSSDGFRLDDRANFSASSNVILKNAFHLAVMLQSVEDDKFRIPCFMMFDNIEDKGMREERSQNFQLLMLKMLSKLNREYQVIMTTSMVAPEINNDQFGVGPFYRKGMHTLEI